MQLVLIGGIIIAIGAVLFALQNDATVTVTLALWSFEGSLAFVLLCTLGLGALVAGLISSPTVIRGQWTVSRLNRQVAKLEARLAEKETQLIELQTELAAANARALEPAVVEGELVQEERPILSLRQLLGGKK